MRDENQPERYRGFEDLPIPLAVRVGCARLTLRALSSLEPGRIVILDSRLGAPFVLTARGTVLGRVEPIAATEGIALRLVADAEESGATRV